MTDIADSSLPRETQSPAAIYTAAKMSSARAALSSVARDPRLADASVLLGALSVVAFWSFGFGVLLGIAALVAGVLATRVSDADRADTVIGLLTGAVGVIAGGIFLAAAVPWL
ncbi:hypothetical protein [Rhodococcus sp. SORGH_AS_0301]|uniref:hypothetical protein n=1 Tax=Rhodococcus sp. SORGH_AS_0301 TaxID=3041780 RepID=UPI002786ECA1|nr:hypothetical protein [Rhodococcus sp. SORGH_AS_0301]MDQ1181902.1 hypothetical protein [Rhodococcus sp. SORGH_AS_0301]